jgi:dATP pyrophosphohydrolase
MRAPYQVLALPFVKEGREYYYAIFKRKDLNIWQFISGGGEEDETPIEAVRRETYEETGINRKLHYIRLSSICTIPTVNIHVFREKREIIMIPEFTFGVELSSKKLKISKEHTQYLWLSCENATKKLKYDSNKSALWELDYRLKNGKFSEIKKNSNYIKKFL